MSTLLYDGSFNGFLTAVFEVYEYKIANASIGINGITNTSLFGNAHIVNTNEIKALRVIAKLKHLLNANGFLEMYKVFLSGLPDMEKHLLAYIQYLLNSKPGATNNFANAHVLFIKQTAQKVAREKHRMEAFIRFQLTKDNLYYAVVQPDYNVLPLIIKHFKTRYADQRWLIYDAHRKYGIYYDLNTVTEITISFSENNNAANISASVFDEKEPLYQILWQQYFQSVNIAARKNTKLHIQHMPKRYWKHLIEKQY